MKNKFVVDGARNAQRDAAEVGPTSRRRRYLAPAAVSALVAVSSVLVVAFALSASNGPSVAHLSTTLTAKISHTTVKKASVKKVSAKKASAPATVAPATTVAAATTVAPATTAAAVALATTATTATTVADNDCTVALAYLAAHAKAGFAFYCTPGSLSVGIAHAIAYTCVPGTGFTCPHGGPEIIIADPACAISYENEASNSYWDFSAAGVINPGSVQNGRTWDPYGEC